MIYSVLAIPVFALFFMFAWGAAPCWQFEGLWRNRFGEHPNPAKLFEVGLAPASRRQASFVVFMGLSGIVLGATWLFSSSPIEWLLLVAGASAIGGAGVGYLLHHVGSGKEKIERYFEVTSRES
ncbi:hypothetical protein [Halorhodospira sp. 9622]|uniref:hypothetical protein n=1 Tax=Halorhodospira sp. 9622 TaxID=2899136 RepID=UPI001EE85FA8|nr:hypothetical protein [Halorhodospira sp. 9622]MCG5537844.1 hypothetical protein [Halorhodospira sp. 9622]